MASNNTHSQLNLSLESLGSLSPEVLAALFALQQQSQVITPQEHRQDAQVYNEYQASVCDDNEDGERPRVCRKIRPIISSV